MLTKTKGAALSTRRPSANRSENNHDLIRGASAVLKAVFADKPAPAAIVAELVGADTVICTGKTTVSRNPLPRARLSRAELATIKVNDIVGAMRAGAVLRLHYERGRPHWHLSTGADVDTEIAVAAIDCSQIESLDDALPIGGAFPQTFVIKQKE